ncbi:MAG: hypothetical protein WCK05_12750 [Planctomycetota bacterium]
MAQTLCPACGKPAVLVDSRAVQALVPELGIERRVVERIVACPAPAGCGRQVRVYRVDLVQGDTRKCRAGK